MRRRVDAEEALASWLTFEGEWRPPLATFEREYRYVPGRRYRADFAFVAERLLVEINGGVFSKRAHGSVAGILMDMARGNIATLHGWRVLRFIPDDITKPARLGATMEMIQQALDAPRSEP